MTVFIDGHSITCTVDEYIELKEKLGKRGFNDYLSPSVKQYYWWEAPQITC